MSPDRALTIGSDQELTVEQRRIIDFKKAATEKVIELIVENLLNSQSTASEVYLKARQSTQSFYTYLTEEIPSKDAFVSVLNQFKDTDQTMRYTLEVIRNSARYILNPVDYDRKVQNAYSESGRKKRRLPFELHQALIECLKNNHRIIDGYLIWDIEVIKHGLREAAQNFGIDIDLEFFNPIYFRKYLREQIFPSYPELEYSPVYFEPGFWEDNLETLMSFTRLTPGGYRQRDYKRMVRYVKEATKIELREATLEKIIMPYIKEVPKSGLSIEKLESAKARLAEEGVIINLVNLAATLEVGTNTLKRFCRERNIDIINIAEVLNEIARIRAEGVIPTSHFIAKSIGFSLLTLEELLREKGIDISLPSAINEAISRIKDIPTQPLTLDNITRIVTKHLGNTSKVKNIKKAILRHKITIFTEQEIEQSISSLKKSISDVTLNNLICNLRTDLETLLRDLEILGYDLSSLGIKIEG